MTVIEVARRCDAGSGSLRCRCRHASGDLDLLGRVAAQVRGAWDYSQKLLEDLVSEIRGKAHAWLSFRKTDTAVAPEEPSRMLSAAVGEPVAPDYVPLIRDQMQLDGPSAAADERLTRASRGCGAL